MSVERLSLADPLFATYAICAAVVILKAVGMSWLTVYRMTKAKGGYRSPEDLRKTRLNPDPDPSQIGPNDYVDRIRRIQLNDLENLPFFLAAGLLFVIAEPSLLHAQLVLYGYVVSRMLHFAAYLTAQTHDVRAAFWTAGSLILIYMTLYVLVSALHLV